MYIQQAAAKEEKKEEWEEEEEEETETAKAEGVQSVALRAAKNHMQEATRHALLAKCWSVLAGQVQNVEDEDEGEKEEAALPPTRRYPGSNLCV